MKKGTRNFLLALLAVVAALIVLVSIATISDAPRIPERHISTTQCIESSFGTKACLGMTKGEVASVWGQPSTVNRTVIENKSSEQWVYGDRLLYFDGDLLTGFQDSR